MGSLIFDTETNGLPECPYYGRFPEYWDLAKYNNARIVQVSYIVTDEEYNIVEESDTIIKADNFTITNSRFHGITESISQTNGVAFVEWAKLFYESLKRCDTIIAHNLDFDINVLRAELYRYSLTYIITLIDTKHFLCTMKTTKNLVQATFKNSNIVKDPNLKELYFYATGEHLENHHNSFYDTQNLYTVVKKLKL